ncbi:MAG: hypothetical protein AAFN92_11065, partial [Bacteroidota bacterium]
EFSVYEVTVNSRHPEATQRQGKILDWGGPGYTDTLVAGVPEVNFSFILPLCCFGVTAIYGYLVHAKFSKV